MFLDREAALEAVQGAVVVALSERDRTQMWSRLRLPHLVVEVGVEREAFLIGLERFNIGGEALVDCADVQQSLRLPTSIAQHAVQIEHALEDGECFIETALPEQHARD